MEYTPQSFLQADLGAVVTVSLSRIINVIV